MNIKIAIGIIIPFIGAVIGSLLIYLLKKDFSKKQSTIFFGVSAGLMIGASIYSLILPSIELSYIEKILPIIPIFIGGTLGIIFIFLSDLIINKITKKNKIDKKIKENLLFFFSITLHNIPEGIAIGVALSTILLENINISLAAIVALTIGITLQNIPESTVISLIFNSNGNSKMKSFLYGVLSSSVEPIAAIFTVLFIRNANNVLIYLLNFAAGAMMYVTVFELIPKIKNDKNIFEGIAWIFIGFFIMMLGNIIIK